METLLYTVRHGETEWNITGRQQGHLDSPLTATGISQAEALARGLTDKKIAYIYTSDLPRALHTAEIIASELCLKVHQDKRLRERHLGLLQGLTRKEFGEKFPIQAHRLHSKDPEYRISNGESARAHFERCVRCAEAIADRHPGSRVLLVTHGGVLCHFFYRALHLPLAEPRRFSLYNAAVNCFGIRRGQWRLNIWGDLSHFQQSDMVTDTIDPFI